MNYNWVPFFRYNIGTANGHITTYIAALTVITTNYPDVKWLKPVGYTIAGVMAFQMMSSRVHWASDYPFAILMGYVIGKNAANRRIKKEVKRDVTGEIIESRFKTNFTFSSHSGYNMAGVVITF